MSSPSKRIFVTGGSGFIGSSVVEQLVKEGYAVRLATRDPKKVEKLIKKVEDQFGTGHVDVCQVKDLSDKTILTPLLQDVIGVIHLANDGTMSTDPSIIIPSTVSNTVNLLDAAAASKSIKHFVLTSSRVAAFNPDDTSASRPTTDSWFDAGVQMAWSLPADHPARGILAYAASKVEGEKAAWAFIKEKKPSFSFSTVLPDFVIGQVYNPERGSAYSTHTVVNDFVKGKPDLFFAFTNPASWFVDVKDVAKVHVAALVDQELDQKRIFAATGPFSATMIHEIVAGLHPHTALPDCSSLPGPSDTVIPNELFKATLLKHYKKELGTLHEAVKENVAQME